MPPIKIGGYSIYLINYETNTTVTKEIRINSRWNNR